MAEQTLGDRDERLAANFDGTEFTECFPTSAGVSFRAKLGTASSRNVGTGTEEVPRNGDLPVFGTAATRDIGTHSNSLSDNIGLIRSRTVAGAATVAQIDHLGVINVNVAAATVTWPSGLAIGTRVQIRKISAYDVTNTDKITITGDGGIVFTASEQASIDIFGDGGNWVFEQVTATRVELVSGWDVGANDNGKWERYANGAQLCRHAAVATYFNTGALIYNWTFPLPYKTPTGIRVSVCANADPIMSSGDARQALPYHRSTSIGQFGTDVGFLNATVFSEGNTSGLDVFATGRWLD